MTAAFDKTAPPSSANAYHEPHARLLADSYQRLTGRVLVDSPIAADSLAKELFDADFVVVSHGLESDPIFNYANRRALELFEMSWHDFVATPSRLSAEAMHRDTREQLMRTVREQGYIDNYAGIRVSSNGQRFEISAAVVWNLIDDRGHIQGQAATFRDWSYVD